MKKIIFSLILTLVLIFAVVASVACDGDTEGVTVTGEVSFVNPFDANLTYGAKVDVTVKDGVITCVRLYTEEETNWVRTSQNNVDENWQIHDEVEAAYDSWIQAEIVGKTVDEVMSWVAVANTNGQYVLADEDGNFYGPVLTLTTGATAMQSSARIIVAIQNALRELAI